jgi:alpha-galactosidase
MTPRIPSLGRFVFLLGLLCPGVSGVFAAAPAPTVVPEETAPHINGPAIFGVRPQHPFLYSVPASGARPLGFSAEGLPSGLAIDPATGLIRGELNATGTFVVTLHAQNRHGTTQKRFVIQCGEQICLTPPLGWNSWNCWGSSVDQEKVLRAARALVSSGLARHGWTYVNIDDGWQGHRTGPGHALQGNEKFPDLKGLCDEIHALGLKIGLYSTPWVTSYAGYAGGSSDRADGAWTPEKDRNGGHRFGPNSFVEADARQWAEWGVDYLKYDWDPLDIAHAQEAFQALRESGRDMVLSLSNSADLALAGSWPKVANSWRTTGDIGDRWQYRSGDHETWRYGVSEIGFSRDPWAASTGPGHWSDADMLVVGSVGWGPSLHPTGLSLDEQYTHIALWCMLSSPLLLGCDLEHLDSFTLALLSNDEIIAVNQDVLGRQATRVATVGSIDVYLKPLDGGGCALGFFNRAATEERFLFNKLKAIGLGGTHRVRDLWHRTDLPDCDGTLEGTVPGHGVLLLQLAP